MRLFVSMRARHRGDLTGRTLAVDTAPIGCLGVAEGPVVIANPPHHLVTKRVVGHERMAPALLIGVDREESRDIRRPFDVRVAVQVFDSSFSLAVHSPYNQAAETI